MLRGIDISHWNDKKTVDNHIKNNVCDFIIRKATEGRTFIDPSINTSYSIPTMGYYHFARPDNNEPEDEAEHFWEAVKNKDNGMQLYFIDWEGASLNYSFDWLLQFKKHFEKISNHPLYVYASLSTYNKYKDQPVKWWLAHHNNNCSDGCLHASNSDVIITQWSSTTIDKDVFLGTLTNWKDLARPIVDPTPSIKVLTRWEEEGYIYEVRRYKI